MASGNEAFIVQAGDLMAGIFLQWYLTNERAASEKKKVLKAIDLQVFYCFQINEAEGSTPVE